MNVASLSLCKELYELSGWDDTEFNWLEDQITHDKPYPHPVPSLIKSWGLPAYDLGYLMRKLPRNIDKITTKTKLLVQATSLVDPEEAWITRYGWDYSALADTPENALCQLAIELFHQGILTKAS